MSSRRCRFVRPETLILVVETEDQICKPFEESNPAAAIQRYADSHGFLL